MYVEIILPGLGHCVEKSHETKALIPEILTRVPKNKVLFLGGGVQGLPVGGN
jgi:hypothetical protein